MSVILHQINRHEKRLTTFVLNKKPQNKFKSNQKPCFRYNNCTFFPNFKTDIYAANVEGNTRKFAALDHNLYQSGKSPINLTSFSKFISFHPNKSDSIELLKRNQQNFSLNYQGPSLPTDANKLPSARKYPYILQGKIDKDVET